jgi:hypothetical protein
VSRAYFVSAGLATDLVDEIEDIHVLLAPLVYFSALLGMTITVPAGFRTDFASVPRIVGAYLLFGGKGKRAAVIHDWAYSGGLNVDRATADLIFREALQASGYSAFTVWAMYQGVRIGGESHFNAPNLPQQQDVAAEMKAP